jgi:hypothetical protein
MAYWMRVFCTSGSPQPLEDVLAWVAGRGSKLWIDDRLTDVDPASASWDQVAIGYRQGKNSFLAEVNHTSDPDASEEVEEFVEFLEDVPDTPQRRSVLSHLKRTTFIVANQIPTSDFEDDGYDAVGEFMRFFVEHNGGMIQADGEGFYEGQDLILELE